MPEPEPMAAHPGRTTWQRLNVALAALALAGACGYFLWQGPVRALSEKTLDLHVYYSASRAWLLGQNPYDQSQLENLFHQAGGQHHVNLSIALPSSLPPMALLAMIPSWPLAQTLWTLLNVLLTVAIAFSLLRMADLGGRPAAKLWLLALVLALAPFHTTIKQGQLSILAAALVVWALRNQLADRRALAGALLGLATAIKPQMGLLLMLMLLLRGHGRVLLWSLLVAGGLTVVAVARMAAAGVSWLSPLRGNLQMFTQGGTGDPTHPESYKMINLQVVLGNLISQPAVVTAVTAALVIVLAAALVLALRGRRDRQAELLAYSMFSVLGLVAFYNRFYSATLLVLPLTWALASLRNKSLKVPAMLTIAMILPFLAPGAIVLAQRFGPGLKNVPGGMALLYHQVFLLAILAVTLGCAAARMQKDSPAEPELPEDRAQV